MNEFDNKALTWDNDLVKVERAKFFAQEIAQKIPFSKQTTAFEYGCGTGLLSFHLQSYLKEITLGDNSDGMLSVLKNKIEKSGFENLIPLKINLEDGILTNQKFDLIYTMLVLHHVIKVDMVINHLYSMLNHNGYLCIIDLDKEDGTFHDSNFVGHNGFDPTELIKQIEMAGFSNTEYIINHYIDKQMPDGSIKSYPVFMMTVQKK